MLTQAKQRHVIHIDDEAMLFRDRGRQIFQKRMIALRNRAAYPADQMMMRLTIGDFVIHLLAPVQGVNQAHFAQEVERAIDGRATDNRILLMHGKVDLLRRNVLARLANGIQNQLPLESQTIPLGMKVRSKIKVWIVHKLLVVAPRRY